MTVTPNDTGFPLTYEDQIRYNLWLADEAHARGLSIGLKNDPGQVADLLPYFDWALTEDCFVEAWCEEMLPFIQMGKPVLAAEYTDTGVTIRELCQEAERLNVSLILKDRELGAWQQHCPWRGVTHLWGIVLRTRVQRRLTTRWSRPGQLRRIGSKKGSRSWPGGSSRRR